MVAFAGIRETSRVGFTISFLACLLFALIVSAADPELEPEQGVPWTAVLLLGPLPVPAEPPTPLLHGSAQAVPEIDLHGPFPTAGTGISVAPGNTLTWQRVAASTGGEVRLSQPGIHWLAARVRAPRWTDLQLRLTTSEALTVYLDGEEIASREADAQADSGEEPAARTEAETLETSASVARGVHTLLVRVEVGPAATLPSPVVGRVGADPESDLAWTVAQQAEPAAFEWSRQMAGISALTVAPQGKLVARRLSWRDPTGEESRGSVEVFDRKGRLLASSLGGSSARPVAFGSDWKQLLLRRSDEGGSELLLWTAPDGPARSVLRGEPALGLIRFSPDGRFLLLASTRGVEDEETEEDAARRRRFLRERVPDYDPQPHLHLLEIATGVRRRLTMPGDFVLEDAAFLPGGRKVVYGRTLPRPERPWFQTEIRVLDLVSGEDRLVATFVGGWEVRPRSFAPAPDGKRLVFVGPPEQVGEGRPEHNVYNKQLWVLDLGTGAFRRITNDLPYSFEGGRGLPGWDRQGKTLFALAGEGSRSRLAQLAPDGEGSWRVVRLYPGDAIGAAALAPDGSAVLTTQSDLASPAWLEFRELPGGDARILERPNDALADRWMLAPAPQDASFTGPGGESIDAWWYPPTVDVDESRTPLVLYYYGGCCPTYRGFNFTHQWLAANGYAVLVINPRGAHGFGDAFADVHVGDWGEQTTADILVGVDAFLAAHPEVDGEHIGIYGGSYGGFLTEYLVSATDRFAAAVSMYGISDLSTYWGQGAWGWTYGDMAVGGATPWADTDLFVRQSPLFRAQHIDTPLLLLHGLADENVLPGESEQLFTALSILDRPVELVLFPGEGHGISGTLANRVAHRTMMLDWFDRFLRDQPEAWEVRWE